MTGLEVFLIFVGIVIVAATFVFSGQLDAKSSITETNIDKEELKRNVKEEVDSATAEIIDELVEKTSVELEKVSNEKIMEVGDYSENILKEIEKNHEEVMFLYNMLNDKEEQIKKTVSDVEMVKESVKVLKKENELLEKRQKARENALKNEAVKPKKQEEEEIPVIKENDYVQDKPVQKKRKSAASLQKKKVHTEDTDNTNNNAKILSMYKEGKTYIEIAKELGIGLGEVRLVVDLYKTRGKG